MEKKSAVLGRDAVFKKTSLLSRLPGYLTVQFVRFSVGVVHDSVEVVARKILKVHSVLVYIVTQEPKLKNATCKFVNANTYVSIQMSNN